VDPRNGVSKIIPGDERSQRIVVWDLPTRIFHWLGMSYLVVSFCVVYIKLPVAIHIASGAALAWLYVGRVVWGFAGSKYSLFKRFFLGDSFGVGHTKLGWVAYFVIFFLVFLIVLSGVYLLVLQAKYLRATKELVDFAKTLHEIPSNILLFLIVLHLDGIFLHIFMYKQNIIRSMINGKKQGNIYNQIGRLTKIQTILAYLWAIGSMATFIYVYWLVFDVKLESFALC
jgi:cytochrome b